MDDKANDIINTLDPNKAVCILCRKNWTYTEEYVYFPICDECVKNRYVMKNKNQIK